tara:strand:+ start:64682 stop:66436 length:1755 start_codon:yes stop_codon:yes gene_type:complete
MLLVEYSVLEARVTESKTGKKKMILAGKFQKCDEANNNNRVYPRKVLESQVKLLNEKIQSRSLVGALDHPPNDEIQLSQASHLITNLEVKSNGDVIGECEILSTPSGKIVQALINDGVKIGISSRGLGTLSEGAKHKTVNEDFKLLTFDLVSDPSTHGAYPSLTESVKLNSQKAQAIVSRMRREQIAMTMLKQKINEALGEDLDEGAFGDMAKKGARGVGKAIGKAAGWAGRRAGKNLKDFGNFAAPKVKSGLGKAAKWAAHSAGKTVGAARDGLKKSGPAKPKSDGGIARKLGRAAGAAGSGIKKGITTTSDFIQKRAASKAAAKQSAPKPSPKKIMRTPPASASDRRTGRARKAANIHAEKRHAQKQAQAKANSHFGAGVNAKPKPKKSDAFGAGVHEAFVTSLVSLYEAGRIKTINKFLKNANTRDSASRAPGTSTSNIARAQAQAHSTEKSAVGRKRAGQRAEMTNKGRALSKARESLFQVIEGATKAANKIKKSGWESRHGSKQVNMGAIGSGNRPGSRVGDAEEAQKKHNKGSGISATLRAGNKAASRQGRANRDSMEKSAASLTKANKRKKKKRVSF